MSTKPKIWLFRIQSEIDAVLQMIYGKSLWHVSKLDQCRLVRLKVWEERYSVRLVYILGCLLPWAWSRLPKHSQEKVKTSKGLGTKIAVITSNGAEAYLKAQVQKDFPDKENVAALHDEQRDNILKIVNEEEMLSRPRKVLQYPTIASYVKAYHYKIDAKKKALDKISKQMSRMAYRNNPFR